MKSNWVDHTGSDVQNLVTVIIVNWNRKKLLQDCLESLRKQKFRDFSTIVVDNGSYDGSLELLSKYYPEIKTISLSENIGFAAANNIAFSQVETKYIALLNNDAVAHPEWLKHLTESLENDHGAGLAAAGILYHDHPEIIDRAGDGYSTAGAGILRGRGSKAKDYAQPEYIFGACAAAAMYRKTMIDLVGFFDPDFFLIYEDVDLSFRAQLSGYQCLYVPAAIVYHKVSSSIIRDSPISVYYGHRNLEWVYFQNMPSGLLLRSLWSHAVYDLAAFFYFMGKGLMKPFLRAKWHAIRSFKRIMKNRRRIQSEKRVANAYLWRLMEKERFLPRLAMRITKK